MAIHRFLARLEHAYDLTYSSGPGGEHYLTVNRRGRDITPVDLERVAENKGIAKRRAAAIVDEATTGIGRFRDIAQTCGVRRSSITQIQKAIDPQRTYGVASRR